MSEETPLWKQYVRKQKKKGDTRKTIEILQEGFDKYNAGYVASVVKFNELNESYRAELAKQEAYVPESAEYSSSPQYSAEKEKQDFPTELPKNVIVEQKALCAIDKALLRNKLKKEAKLALLDTTSNYKEKLLYEKGEAKRCFNLNRLLRRKNENIERELEQRIDEQKLILERLREVEAKKEPEPEYKVVRKVSREKLDAKLKAKKAKEPVEVLPKKKRRPLAFIKDFQEKVEEDIANKVEYGKVSEDINEWIKKGRPREKVKRGRPAKEPVEKVAKKRGRPKKEAPVEPKVPKKRGRPFGATAEASRLKKQVVPLGDILRELKVPYSEIQKRFEEEIGEKVERGFIKTAQFKKFVEGLQPNELLVQYNIQNYFDKLGKMPTTTLKQIREDFEKSSGISLDEWKPLFKKIAVKYAESVNK